MTTASAREYARAGRESPDHVGTRAATDREVVAAFLHALREGREWFPALLCAIAGWSAAEEVREGRRYCYLVGGEAFDWLLLAERLLAEAGDLVPEEEQARLLVHNEPPVAMEAARLRELIGPLKYRAHLNFWYGVTVEEAVQEALLEEAAKARQGQARHEDALEDETFLRLYGALSAGLFAEFRRAAGLPEAEESSLGEQREFTYWLFKRRVAKSDPARLASDTRRGLLLLHRLRPGAWRWVEEGTGEEEKGSD